VAEPDGFDAFVVARSPALLRFGWLLTGNRATAEDLVQAALIIGDIQLPASVVALLNSAR
jgi:hypothetical protein